MIPANPASTATSFAIESKLGTFMTARFADQLLSQ
jgi:hypothetical protein